ncbi:unnamed protein product [Schistosoma margrebowiei]|uniref:Uncharacterized protein n=1 Tax=Schistosoma margrebowiei TaxID=48269 RepID=A0A183MMW6_9TREM|nr:unnamed protein product [Schistosoma margrebowiei]
MKTSTSDGSHRIQYTARNRLDDLDFVDDLALLSHIYEYMEMTTTSEAAALALVDFNIHKGKSKILKYNTENINPITLDGETLDDVESFTYMGSIIDKQARSDADVKAQITKSRTTFLQLKNIWNSKQLSKNKYRIHNLNYTTSTMTTTTTTTTTSTTNTTTTIIINYKQNV